jgi:hypothetical protein
MTEEWRKIPGFEKYEASSQGNVRRDGRILRPVINNRGYRVIDLCVTNIKTKMTIGKCICLAFHPAVDGKTEADHINRNRLDDRIENLRWANRSEQSINRDIPLPNTGHRHIILTHYGTYRVQIYRNCQKIYTKTFKTLEEAIKARDDFLTS